MIEVTKIIEWDMGHRVPNHKSKCRNLHGHRYRPELTVTGDLIDREGDSSEGMVFDFSDIKALMTTHIHDVLDHGFMYAESDPIMTHLFLEHEPAMDLHAIPVPFVPTAENLAVWCYEQLVKHMPASITITRVRIFETPNSWADYTPTA